MQISQYLYVPLFTWALAQAVKFSLAVIKGQYKPALLFSSGGMPSVHSATVASLATVALIDGGPISPLFGITGVFAAIVMYDSLGVRRAAGEQARALNHLIDDLLQTGTIKSHDKYGHLKEILGHRPLEVAVGAIMGVLLTGIFMLSTLQERLPWLLSVPSTLAMRLQIGLAIALVVSGLAAYVLSVRPKNRLSSVKPFIRNIFYSDIVIAIALGLAVFLQRQQIGGLSSWALVLGILIIFLLWHLALWYRLLVDGELRSPVIAKNEARRDKWLNQSGKANTRKRKK